jgi:hypothetical protein
MTSRPTTIEGIRGALELLHTAESLHRASTFQPRPDDLFLAAYPKSGTTWIQQIVHGLRTGGSMDFDEISSVVPWIEVAFDLGMDPAHMPTPRAFKTHFRRDEVPLGARYIYVVRDPKDVVVSFFHFFEGWLFETGTIDLVTFAKDFFFPGSNSGRYWPHVRSWWDARDADDTLFLCFEDLKADLPTAVQQIAAFIEADPANIAIATKQAAFAFMKEHQRQFDEHILRDARDAACGLPPGPQALKLRAGRVGDNRQLTPELVADFDAMWQEQFPEFANYAALRAAIAAARSSAL